MKNLIDIPVIVSTLFTFFSQGGTPAAVEALKGFTINGAMKLSELKDELQAKSEVNQAVQQLEKNPLDENLKMALIDVLSQTVQKHPAISAKKGILHIPVNTSLN